MRVALLAFLGAATFLGSVLSSSDLGTPAPGPVEVRGPVGSFDETFLSGDSSLEPVASVEEVTRAIATGSIAALEALPTPTPNATERDEDAKPSPSPHKKPSPTPSSEPSPSPSPSPSPTPEPSPSSTGGP